MRIRRLLQLTSAGLAAVAVSLITVQVVLAQTVEIDPTDPGGLTLGLALTAAGATVMAAFITGIIELLKSVLAGHERAASFILSAIVVIAAAVSENWNFADISADFALIVAWYGLARLANAHYDEARARGIIGGGNNDRSA